VIAPLSPVDTETLSGVCKVSISFHQAFDQTLAKHVGLHPNGVGVLEKARASRLQIIRLRRLQDVISPGTTFLAMWRKSSTESTFRLTDACGAGGGMLWWRTLKYITSGEVRD
jgi:hypothetical protein